MGDVRTGGGVPLRWVLAVLAAAAVVASGYGVGTLIASGRDGGDDVSAMADAPAQAPPSIASSSTSSSTSSLPEATTTPPAATTSPPATNPPTGLTVFRCDEVAHEEVPGFDSGAGDRAFCTESWAVAVRRGGSGIDLTVLRREPAGWIVVGTVNINLAPVPKALVDQGVDAGHASVLCEAVASDPALGVSC